MSSRRTYSSPQIRQDITFKLSEISDAPRSLSPRSSRTTIVSFDILRLMRAFRTSDPQRTESNPSASKMLLLLQRSGTTSMNIARDLFIADACTDDDHPMQD